MNLSPPSPLHIFTDTGACTPEEQGAPGVENPAPATSGGATEGD